MTHGDSGKDPVVQPVRESCAQQPHDDHTHMSTASSSTNVVEGVTAANTSSQDAT